jgi:2-dehydro-3-deoxyphosphogluconate aldolase / (4S)-4-hydroxy-2-oxoglutarate aldolase
MYDLLKKIETYPVVPIFYHDDSAVCKSVLEMCYNGGVRVFEFVNRGAFAKVNFEALIAYRDAHFPDLKLGVGTIKTHQEAVDFIALKADFIVSPIVNKDIAQVTTDKGVLWIPGAMTPTEIAYAQSLGAPLIKLFPGDVLGPQFIKAVKPLFPGLKFMVTGGVLYAEDNVNAWFSSGVTAIGMGSQLFQSKEADAVHLKLRTLFGWIS